MPEPSKDNRLTRAANTIKAVCQALVSLILASVLVGIVVSKSCRTRIPTMAKEAGIAEISGNGVKFRQIEEHAQDVATQIAALKIQDLGKQGPKTLDVPSDPQTTRLLVSTQELRASAGELVTNDSWVYVGEYDRAKHVFVRKPAFNVDDSPPSRDSTIIANVDVYERKKAPYKDERSQWQLGPVRGVLPEGKSVRVKEVLEVEGETAARVNLWVRASES